MYWISMAWLLLPALQDHSHELHLNEGQKWTANQATHDGMIQLLALINQEDVPESLQSDMDTVIKGIITQCDMTGEAHDQLHIVLVPIIEAVNAMNTSEATAEHLNNIRHQLDQYFAHFQAP
ncbi:MAG: hypothetical protein KDC35_04425 [Acidobacteria bacterium]|nr:hypothetical protein [Acidobacteriota bacterium]